MHHLCQLLLPALELVQVLPLPLGRFPIPLPDLELGLSCYSGSAALGLSAPTKKVGERSIPSVREDQKFRKSLVWGLGFGAWSLGFWVSGPTGALACHGSSSPGPQAKAPPATDSPPGGWTRSAKAKLLQAAS